MTLSPEPGIVIISDLGLSDDERVIEICNRTFAKTKASKWQVRWVDHHPWSKKAVESLKPFIDIVLDESGKKCAADLMYETFLRGNELAATLARLAHTMDFFTNDQYLTPTSELIHYYWTFSDFYRRLTILAQKAAHGRLWDVEMQEQYNKYAVLRDDAKKQILSTIIVKEVNALKVAFVPTSPYIHTSIFSAEVFQKTHADIAIFYGTEGKVSIRRNNESVHCNKIAANLNEGGGHEFAAGATLRTNPLDTNAVISELETAVRKCLVS